MLFTVIETPTFQKMAGKLWTVDERLAFIDWIAAHPTAGDVVPGAEGARKVRWAAQGRGKRGGARVIYFNFQADELILLVAVYAKSERDNLSSHEINRS